MSVVLVAGMTLAPMPTAKVAIADEATEQALSDSQSRVEETARTYNDVLAQIDALEAQIDENNQRIAEIETELPAQREVSNNSYVALYKLSQEGCSLIDMLLGAGDLTEFLQNLDYINRIQEKNSEEVRKLADMENELQSTRAQLESARSNLESQRIAAEDALTEAQQAREAAQAAAEEKKREEEEAAAAAAAAAAAGQAAAQAAVETPADANTGSTVAASGTTETVGQAASNDGVNWSVDKQTFVAEWSARIDNYLSGSPLAGQGTTFAAAAWDYGVDPRWSPAISYVESSKGAACFLEHNAWGWGSSSWDTWEEAINDHVAGLARGYGYTVTQEAAQKYCPPNWELWYNRVTEQMDMI